jgi:hypothetical protein
VLEALDIIIGLALVFTLVSLLGSVINEWIAASRTW